MELSESLENYLEIIYNLSKENKHVHLADIAKALDVKYPSVTYALNILKEDGLIDYEKYKPVSLTKKGARIAKNLQNRHDILKHFFEDVLEVEENRADLVACRMEHFLDNNLCKKFSQIAEQLKSIHLEEDCCPHCKEKIYHKA